jgi:hypothetical protein
MKTANGCTQEEKITLSGYGIYGNTIESVKSNNYNELGARQKSED